MAYGLAKSECTVELLPPSGNPKGVSVSVVVFGCPITILTKEKGPLAQVHMWIATSHIPLAFMSTV